MGKRARSPEGSERADAEQTDTHSETHAVHIVNDEVGKGSQGGGGEGEGEEGEGEEGCAGKADCPHLPPYDEKTERRVSRDDFKPTRGKTDPYPDGVSYYTKISKCQGKKKNGKPCDKNLMENKYLPLTRFELADGRTFKGKHTFQEFSRWTNPLPGHGPADFAREARTQVEGNRGWTKFWCAVHHLGADLDSSQDQKEIQKWKNWLRDKTNYFYASKSDFENAGLLASGGPGDWEARVRKFDLAEKLIKEHNLSSAPKKVNGKGNPEPTLATTASRSQTHSNSLRTDIRTQGRPFPASQGGAARGPAQSASQQQCLPTHPTGNGQSVMMMWSTGPMESSPADNTDQENWWYLSPPSSARIYSGDLGDDCREAQGREEAVLGGKGGAARPAPPVRPDNELRGSFGGEAPRGAPQDLSPPQNPETVGPPLSPPPPPPAETIAPPLHFRPMFLLLLNLMDDVWFVEGANDERVAWAQFDPQEYFEQRVGDLTVGDLALAQCIGGYLHRGILQSSTLDEFFGAYEQPTDPLFEQFQRLKSATHSDAVAASMSAIYCYWRIEQALLHQCYATQRDSWSYTVKTSLQQILTKMQQDVPEDHICDLLQGLFATMDLQVQLGLEDLHTNCACMYASRRFKTGSFAELLWAPHIWCLFVMLRLRHDEDFSRTLWGKGVRFVGCDLDPTAAAPEKESWTQQVLSPGVLADGGGGGGGGGVAANPFAEDPNSPEMLVARLLKAEGREVDDEARAADGGVVAGLPLLSARVSKTMERMRLVYQGLPLIARPPPPPPTEFVSLLSKLDSCRMVTSLSLSEAIDRLGQETCDMIVKPTAVAVKGGGGGTRTRGGGGSRGRQSKESIGSEVERVWNDLHDFRDESGFWTSDWLLQVTVKQHDGDDDEEGEHIESSRITKGPNLRLYSVDPDLFIKVTIKNLSLTRDISFIPVYVEANEAEQPKALVELKSGDDFELPIPLQKEAGEEDDGWVIKDNMGKTVLKLRFTL